ncbi:DNA_ligase_A_M domain-containing protein/DNA_ligase_A_N domain-containing protein/DNA_ligase_A_C domain-containing protein/PTCB-BRCT domain-containing protein [Cephalotus follicularis]|uniref:DNA ligase n=1 Tax=Cephalotus follicularis TaxID=3775 RepID=A0A1Q3AVA8_CEPFO|nr:DNA_ligase_A_M domain-containing protein/DNA_ligase_A_N domain-containing protein/DNA_ligase_A_C domain-containing protein/PTCB-BRCT domain-containing protein [Cephalotus follicularis]
MTSETKFSVLVSLFNWIQKTKTASKKRSKFRKFLDTFCDSNDYFSAVRLILPWLDRERGTYGLKESVLALCLIDALAMSRDSDDALRLINWRKGGARTGANAGNFPLVAAEVLQRRQGLTSAGLTIGDLNHLLDRLASCENRAEKTSLLSTLIKKTNAQEMKWIVMIILKDLKLGISEKSIFHEFHPDAEDLFNVTCDLKMVCEKLKDRSQRHKRQDIEIGKAVRPQLAMRVGDAAAAWKKLNGKEVVVECKFDGDRIQIHKNGTKIHYFSRNFLDHSEYEQAMSDIIAENVLVDRCILDGEILVWDKSLNRFAEFGSNQEIAKAVNDGLDSDRQLCYVAFDILYLGDTSVIHQSLKERHELLQKIVKPLKGRLEILVPNGGRNTHRPPGETCWSLIANNVVDVERFFKETIDNRDEGIVLKDLGSKWEPSDRSGKWLKLKPEYIRAGSDLDVLIIGGYYGSGRRGGEVAQFLCGLAECPSPNTYPRRFISFCRVGTGLSDDELDTLVLKMKPFLRKNEYPKKVPPSFYEVTNNSKERPDVWVDSPEKSVILSITSDIRTIRSEVFAAPYGLRFPRIDRVRYDKPWYECLDVQSFVELVQSSNGTTYKGTENGGPPVSKPKRVNSPKKGERKNVSVVPSHFMQTDVSRIKGETLIFSNMMFNFVNVPPTNSLDSLHQMIVENGGTFSMNLNNSVTHCVAAESKGIKYHAAKLHGDIIHYSWVLECCSQKKLIPLQPKYFLFLSEASKKKLQEEVDEYSDSYYWDLDLADIRHLLSNTDRSEDAKTVDFYKKKYCPELKWSLFHGCCIYFYTSVGSVKPDWEVLLGIASRRLQLEVFMGGGNVSDNLAHATHLVVFSISGLDVNFNSLLSSFIAADKQFLCSNRLHVVRSQWLEDSLQREQKLLEDSYSLKPSGMVESIAEECEHELHLEGGPHLDNRENKAMSSFPVTEARQRGGKIAPENSLEFDSPKRGGQRKRGRPVSKSSKKGKEGTYEAHKKTRARLGNKAAKIYEYVSDECCTDDDKPNEEEINMCERNHEILNIISNENLQSQTEMRREESSNNAPEIEMAESRYGHENEKHEKLEVMVDPVQAMLLDMIPSLGNKKFETKNPITPSLGIEKVESTNPTPENEKPPSDSSSEPVKKKKVSYKDIVGVMLKDW